MTTGEHVVHYDDLGDGPLAVPEGTTRVRVMTGGVRPGPASTAAVMRLHPDAFAGSVGKRVTVRGPDGQVIGHGTVTGADGSCEITLTGGRPLDDLRVDDAFGLPLTNRALDRVAESMGVTDESVRRFAERCRGLGAE